MMNCKQCGQTTPPREKTFRKVVETRGVVYSDGSAGWEIVKEVAICKNCLRVRGEDAM